MKNRGMKAVILAAGKSTRMKSSRSKVVHSILGKEIINYLLDSLIACEVPEQDIVIVAGNNTKEIQKVVRKNVVYARQEQQLGTAHALLSAGNHIQNFPGELLVLVGDNPYITRDELQRLIDLHHKSRAACSMISAIFPETPPPYGRIIRNNRGDVIDVIEEMDATAEQLQIREVNSSIYLFDNSVAYSRLKRIGNDNIKKEYYLTDIVRILSGEGFSVQAVPAIDYRISIGINNRWELQEAQQSFSRIILKDLALEKGVTVLQPETTTVENDVQIGRDTVLFPFVYIGAGTRIGNRCRIGPFVYLRNIEIPDDQEISFRREIESEPAR